MWARNAEIFPEPQCSELTTHGSAWLCQAECAPSRGAIVGRRNADEHWSEDDPNPKALYPRLSPLWNNNNTKASTLYVRNGKMLRLKTAEIGYTYKKMRVYVSGTNLLTFAPFKYWDPEKGSGNGLGYPLQRTYNLGFQFNF